MVQEIQGRKCIALLAALLLAAGVAQADVITGAGPGAGPDRTVKSGGKGEQKGGVSVAAGDITGDSTGFQEERAKQQKINPLLDSPGKSGHRKKPLPDVAKGPKEPRPLPNPKHGLPAKPVEKAEVDLKRPKPDLPTKPDVPPAPIAKPVVTPVTNVNAPPTPTKPQTPAQVQAQPKPQQALLLPAVQKVRDAAAR